MELGRARGPEVQAVDVAVVREAVGERQLVRAEREAVAASSLKPLTVSGWSDTIRPLNPTAGYPGG